MFNITIILRVFVLACLLPFLVSAPVYAGKDLVLGIYAYLPHEVMQTRYQPLVDYLNQQLPDHTFHLKVLELDEFQPAIEQQHIDFIFTNPRHYIILRAHNNFFGPIATLLKKKHDDQVTRYLGGVIFTLKSQHNINKLADLKKRRIAIPSTRHLGGFQCQSYELFNAGVDVNKDVQLIISGSHNQVVQDVLSGKAEVGFVRTEILEELQQQGVLNLDLLKIIHPQKKAGFPFIVSTRLYPEWPFLALQQVALKTVSKVTAALMLLNEKTTNTTMPGIAGFAPPADYFPVEQVARTLHLPPYAEHQKPSWDDIWQQYYSEILIVLLFLVIILVLLIALLRQNRRIFHSETLKKLILNSVPEIIWLKDKHGNYLLCNPLFARFVNKNSQEITGKTDFDLFQHSLAVLFSKNDQKVIEQAQPLKHEQWITFPDNRQKILLEITKTPLKDRSGNIIGVLGTGYDITQRKAIEDRQRITSSVFTNSQQGIIITDARNIIIEVNPAACKLTGYSKEELIGQSPAIFKSEEHSQDFYNKMWQELNSKGKWSGEIINRKKSGEIYTEFLDINAVFDSQGKIQYYISIFSDLSYLKEHQQQLEYIAYNDSLTSLPNRLLLANRLEQALSLAERQNRLVAIAYLDLDGFKIINDRYGHTAGDQVLVTIAQRLKSNLRAEDTVARLGGDEFVLLIVNLQAIAELEQLITRLIEQINQPIELNNQIKVSVSASIGISLSHFDDHPPEILLRHADYAMYQAKKQGKNQYCFFRMDDAKDSSDIIKFQESVRGALTLHQFELYYQPKINMLSGEIIGFEALIRWHHPEKGLLLPGSFLPQIENTPIIIEIGQWVAEQAMLQIQQWQKQGLDICVSINIAALQIQEQNFISKLASLLSKYPDVQAQNLELEIVESVVQEDIEKTRLILEQCKEMGFKLSLDDFGSGYSSLTYLKQLPVNTIKIDRLFVRDILQNSEDVAILETIIKLCQSLNKTPLAEGIETVHQGDLLLNLGCEYAQGFGIGKPMPASEISHWIQGYQAPEQWLKHKKQPAPAITSFSFSFLHIATLHNQFVERVLKAVQDQAPSLFPEYIHDPHHCKFGQWLELQKQTAFGGTRLYQQIYHKHQEAHRLAKVIFDCFQTQQTKKPQEYCKQLLSVHNELIKLLVQLYSNPGLIDRKALSVTEEGDR